MSVANGILGLFFGGIGAIVLAAGVYGTWEAWGMKQTDTVPIEAAATAAGSVAVEGTIQSRKESLTTPLAGEEAVEYEWTITERNEYEVVEAGETSDVGQSDIEEEFDKDTVAKKETEVEWNTLDEGGETVPFAVTDDTGEIPIDPETADMRVGQRNTSTMAFPDKEPPEEGKQFLETADTSVETLDGDDKRKISESRIDIGREVAVFGEFHADQSGIRVDSPVIEGGDAKEAAEGNFKTYAWMTVAGLLISGFGGALLLSSPFL